MFPETHEFLSWADSVPPYSQTAAEGIPNEAYVHTIQNEVRTLHTILLATILLLTQCSTNIGVQLIWGGGGGGKDGAVVSALAFHQCGPGSIPGPGVICGLSLLLVLVLAPRV